GLYRASLLSQDFVQAGLGPEEIIAIHFESVDALLGRLPLRRQVHAFGDAHQFLLEVMIAYGVKYREYLDLRLRETIREAEERASVERQHALEADQARQRNDEILGMIAHELRTPLTAVKSSLDLAERSLARGQTERLPPLLGVAREALGRLSRLTANLVHATKDQPPMLDRGPQDVAELMRQACLWAQAAATAKGVALHMEPGPARLYVPGNADALLSVFGNLLSNAIRYTPGGGTVTARYGLDGDSVWAVVTDTGIGMTPEVQARVFDKFYRAPEARQHEQQGLGLGLTLVQQLVTAHEGRLEVESTPGAGSAFRVLLPLLAGEPSAPEGDDVGEP
ncbi:MAG TPA: HAMP domain-containing sensor histidine kinase, partial [Thermomicrobiales bacterium]|nr:HAMP domain-containing sensor histidine kinase [Thermomicrobiales bacterium]